jgi:hypothetical protein
MYIYIRKAEQHYSEQQSSSSTATCTPDDGRLGRNISDNKEKTKREYYPTFHTDGKNWNAEFVNENRQIPPAELN